MEERGSQREGERTRGRGEEGQEGQGLRLLSCSVKRSQPSRCLRLRAVSVTIQRSSGRNCADVPRSGSDLRESVGRTALGAEGCPHAPARHLRVIVHATRVVIAGRHLKRRSVIAIMCYHLGHWRGAGILLQPLSPPAAGQTGRAGVPARTAAHAPRLADLTAPES